MNHTEPLVMVMWDQVLVVGETETSEEKKIPVTWNFSIGFLVESRIGLKFALWKIPPQN